MVRSSAGSKLHERKELAVRTWCANKVWCSCLSQRERERERAQAGARHSGGSRLHDVGQITRRLSDVDVVHERAKLVGNSVTNW